MPFDELPLLFGEDGATLSWPLPLDLPFKDAKEKLTSAFERVYATQLLARSGQNISEAARRAGLSRRHFFELLKKHDLLPRDADED